MVRQRRIARGARQSSNEPSLWAEIWEMVWMPVLLALLAMSITWAVWYYTTEPGEPEAKKPAGGHLWDEPEKCVSLEALNKMFTHGAIAGGTGGVYFYIMLRRERLAREAAERRLDEERQRADEERQRADEERRRADRERRRADRERRQLLARIAVLEAEAANSGQGQTGSE